MNNSEILGEEAAVRQIVENDFSATDGVFEDDSVTSLRANAFYNKSTLESLILPNLNSINGATVFQKCTALETISFPNLTVINGGNIFDTCPLLTEIRLPKLTTLYMDGAFRSASANKIILPILNSNKNWTFNGCKASIMDLGYITSLMNNSMLNLTNLTALILRSGSVCANSNSSNFNGTKYAVSGAGGAYVYVPRDLISSYQTATNWSTLYAAHNDMFRPLEDYTVDGTTTGAFDEALVATPTNPMYAVTNLDVSVDENHQRYITTTAEGHITYSSGAFTSENWSAVCIQSDEVGQTGSVSGNYFSIPAGSTVTMVIKNMTATQWNNVSGMRNQVSVRMRRSGADLYNISWNEMKQAFYTDGLHRYEESYTNTGSSAINIVYIDLYGSLTPNNTLDFSLMVLLDGVRII